VELQLHPLAHASQAIRVMKEQPAGGHIFNMDGAGARQQRAPLS
jgi:hypothetical protein